MRKILILLLCGLMAATVAPASADTITQREVDGCAQRYPATAQMLARREIETGIPARVMLAIAVIESRCNPMAIGRSGEIGAYQEMPFEVYRTRPKTSELRWPQPVINVDGDQNRMMVQTLEAQRLLHTILQRNGWRMDEALRTWNCGGNRGSVCDRYFQRVVWEATAPR